LRAADAEAEANSRVLRSSGSKPRQGASDELIFSAVRVPMTTPEPKLPPVNLEALAVLNELYPGQFNTVDYAVAQGEKIMADHTAMDGSPRLLMRTFLLYCANPSRKPIPGPTMAKALQVETRGVDEMIYVWLAGVSGLDGAWRVCCPHHLYRPAGRGDRSPYGRGSSNRALRGLEDWDDPLLFDAGV